MVLFSGVDETRSHGEVGDDKEEEDQEAADTHGPAEVEEVEESSEHDGEDDAAETGAGGGDAQGKGAATAEPGADGVDAGVEERAGTNGAADALGQEELVVFGGDGGHHYAKDVEDSAG